MFDSPSIIVGLEIGTSKICAVVGEINAGHSLNIIGVGQGGILGDCRQQQFLLRDDFRPFRVCRYCSVFRETDRGPLAERLFGPAV